MAMDLVAELDREWDSDGSVMAAGGSKPHDSGPQPSRAKEAASHLPEQTVATRTLPTALETHAGNQPATEPPRVAKRRKATSGPPGVRPRQHAHGF